MATFVRPSVYGGAMTLPGHYYTSRDIFERESDVIFSHSWLCVGRQEQIPLPGDYFLAEVAGESLIVVRDERGAIHAHYNVCRHRGTRMCTELAGRFGGSIQCPYHAWTYALGGTLQTARLMDGVAHFERSEYPLISVAVDTQGGFIFINLSASAGKGSNAVAALARHLFEWKLEELRVAKSARYDLQCNWKFVFQNYSECYHCALIHPQLTKLSAPDSGRNDFVEGAVLGGYMTLREQGGSLTPSGATSRPPIGEFRGDELTRVYYYTVFPTLLISLHPDYVMTHRIVPMGPARTVVICEWLFAPATIRRADFDPSDAFEFWDVTNRQDWHVSELSQMGVASRAYRPGPYADAEGLVAAFDRHYLERMEV